MPHSGRNSATDDKFPHRILHGRYDAGFTAKLQLKDIRLYLETARAAGIADEVADTVVKVWTGMDHALPAPTSARCTPTPATAARRRADGSSSPARSRTGRCERLREQRSDPGPCGVRLVDGGPG